MTKRYVEECDLCKKEAELDNQLMIKPNKSKKAGRTYDLCDACKELLEKVLVSRDGLKIFGAPVPVRSNGTPENRNDSEDDPAVLTLPDGSKRKIPTRAELAKGTEEDPGAVELPEGTTDEGDACLHMNRTRPAIGDGTSKITVKCKDCGVSIPYKSARQRELELNAKIPDGVRMKGE